jgi:hypothetical protein
LGPVVEALAMVREHKDYVPISRRPAPYQRRSVEVEFKGCGLPLGVPTPVDVIRR